jgi:uncharacterized protein YaaN involved in tellurite resistance
MPANTSVVRMSKAQKAETEIAVLQLQVKHVENQIAELKDDNKSITEMIKSNHKEMNELLKEIQASSRDSTASLAAKVSALEKWRWMLMGAGVALGTLGYNTIASLLK